MAFAGLSTIPTKSSYDVVIIGGAMLGASTAWFLTDNPDFNGSVLVIERDPTYEFSATAKSNSCIRQQFSEPLNVQISQFGADFIQNMRQFMGDDPRVPHLRIQNYGYMYLADTPAFANVLRDSHAVQSAAGAAIDHLVTLHPASAEAARLADAVGLSLVGWLDRQAADLHPDLSGAVALAGSVHVVPEFLGNRSPFAAAGMLALHARKFVRNRTRQSRGA